MKTNKRTENKKTELEEPKVAYTDNYMLNMLNNRLA